MYLDPSVFSFITTEKKWKKLNKICVHAPRATVTTVSPVKYAQHYMHKKNIPNDGFGSYNFIHVLGYNHETSLWFVTVKMWN